jgi:hypothetical protein
MQRVGGCTAFLAGILSAGIASAQSRESVVVTHSAASIVLDGHLDEPV